MLRKYFMGDLPSLMLPCRIAPLFIIHATFWILYICIALYTMLSLGIRCLHCCTLPAIHAAHMSCALVLRGPSGNAVKDIGGELCFTWSD